MSYIPLPLLVSLLPGLLHCILPVLVHIFVLLNFFIAFDLLLLIYMYCTLFTYCNIGPSAFNQWKYNLTLQNNTVATIGTEYHYSDLLPNTAYIVNIFPSAPRAVGNVDDAVMSSWIVQTVDDGQCVVYCIVANPA